jgi:putative NADH-flavin reductase
MKILVLGGTRGLGLAVVRAAFEAQHSLTVLARHVGDFETPVNGVRMVVGDVGDAADVERAIAGQDAVVWSVGVAPTRRPVHVFSRGTQYMLASMERFGVRRLLCVTGVGAGDSKGQGGFLQAAIMQPLLRRTIFEDKSRQEAQIRASALDWTIVRPAALADGPATGACAAYVLPDVAVARRVRRADVAAFIVDNVDASRYLRKSVLLTA